MLDSRGKTKGGWFFILGFNMLKPNMSNTISIGTCSSDLYIHYFFETSGTASCGTTGMFVILGVHPYGEVKKPFALCVCQASVFAMFFASFSESNQPIHEYNCRVQIF